MKKSNSSEPNTIKPLVEFYSQLGRPWAVPLIFVLGERGDDLAYTEIRSRVISTTGKRIDDTTLSGYLSSLANLGLVQRIVHAESPHDAEYGLTMAGHEIYKNMVRMQYWTDNGFSKGNVMMDSISAC
jgi:DNA-binding HxlR family transcriptional regulator